MKIEKCFDFFLFIFSTLKDHVVLLPEEYYTAKKLQPDGVQPCLAGQPKETICNDYKYISLKSFQSVQGESGTNSKGFGFEVVEKTQLFNDPDILQQLPVINDMAELSSKQVGGFTDLLFYRKMVSSLWRLLQSIYRPFHIPDVSKYSSLSFFYYRWSFSLTNHE